VARKGRALTPSPKVPQWNTAGEWRCDLHPRSDSTGTKVVIDSTHGGEGRQLYLIDVAEIVLS